jgi:recombination protein RecA
LSLSEAMAKVDKQFGTGTVMRLGDDAHGRVEVIPTGSLSLDRALGIGGLPRGRIVEIYGPESSGKSTLALHVVANAQKLGTAVILDTEHSVDPLYCRALGVDVDNMLICQPDSAEQGLEVAENLIDSGEVSVLVIDSIAAMVPHRELSGDYGDSNVGVMARLMSQACRKLVGRVEKTNTLLLCINQLRQKVGVIYGSPEVTSGGVALKYYCSVRIDIRKSDLIKDGADAVGNRTRIKVVKNKLAPPLRVCEVDIRYGEGVSREVELLDLGVEYDVLSKSGTWFKYRDRSLGQGKENARLWLTENPETAAEIEAQIRSAIAPG